MRQLRSQQGTAKTVENIQADLYTPFITKSQHGRTSSLTLWVLEEMLTVCVCVLTHWCCPLVIVHFQQTLVTRRWISSPSRTFQWSEQQHLHSTHNNNVRGIMFDTIVQSLMCYPYKEQAWKYACFHDTMFSFKASNSSFHIKMACIFWLRPGITSKWDNQCLTCSPLKGLYVTCMSGICWYMICKFNKTEYFLGDIMLRIMKRYGQHFYFIIA